MIETLKNFLIPLISFAITIGVIYGIFKTRLNYLEKRTNDQNRKIDCIETELQKLNKKLATIKVFLILICKNLNIDVNGIDNDE